MATTEQRPRLPDGWDRVADPDTFDRLTSTDRRRTVVVKAISTHDRTVYRVILFESDDPHGYGDWDGETIVETPGEIPEAVRELARRAEA